MNVHAHAAGSRALTTAPARDQDEQIAAELIDGGAISVIAADDAVERSARLGAVLALATSAGLRIRRVGNGLQAPLTLARIAFQLSNDGGEASPAPGAQSRDELGVLPPPRTVLAIEQAETLAPAALAAVRSMDTVSVLLVGSSALTATLQAAGPAPPIQWAARPEPSAASSDPAFDHDVDAADAMQWDLDAADPDGAEPVSSSGQDLAAPTLLRAEPRPPAAAAISRHPALLGALLLAGCAAVAAGAIYETVSRRPPRTPDTAPRPSAAVTRPLDAALPEPAPTTPHGPAEALPSDQGAPARVSEAVASPKPADPAPVASAPVTPAPVTPVAVAPGPSAPASGPTRSEATSVPAPSASVTRPNMPASSPEPLARLRRDFAVFLQQPEYRRHHLGPKQQDALFAQYLAWRGRQSNGSASGPGSGPHVEAPRASRIVLHVPAGAPAEHSPHVHRLIGLLGALGRVETRVVDRRPEKPSVRFYYPEDAQAARQVAVALDKAEPGWESRDFTAFRPRPVQGTIDVWSPQG